MDRDKVDKAIDSFVKKFDDKNLVVADREIQDLITVAQFNPSEKRIFLENIRKFLTSQSVTLDSINFV